MPILGHYIPFNRGNLIGVTTEEGVYELFGDEPIFFGASVDDPYGLRGRLEAHLHGDLTPGGDEITHFRFEVNTRPQAHLEDMLIEFEREHGYLPKYNALQGNEATA